MAEHLLIRHVTSAHSRKAAFPITRVLSTATRTPRTPPSLSRSAHSHPSACSCAAHIRLCAPLRFIVPSSRRAFSASSARAAAFPFGSIAGRRRTWKGAVVRWGLALGVVYWYNTTTIFAEGQTDAAIERLDESIHHVQESTLPTIDAIVEEKQRRRAERAAAEKEKQALEERQASAAATAASPPSNFTPAEGEAESIEELEGEASQQGAFNEETGEINWECPCLGGMAHGPCGEEFKAAFSCFVYSKEEPKGMECIENFKGMQDCFRAHPEVYASELEDDDPEETELRQAELQRELDAQAGSRSQGREGASEHVQESGQTPSQPPSSASHADHGKSTEPAAYDASSSKSIDAITPSKDVEQVMAPESKPARSDSQQGSASRTTGGDEGGDLVPKAAHDGGR